MCIKSVKAQQSQACFIVNVSAYHSQDLDDNWAPLLQLLPSGERTLPRGCIDVESHSQSLNLFMVRTCAPFLQLLLSDQLQNRTDHAENGLVPFLNIHKTWPTYFKISTVDTQSGNTQKLNIDEREQTATELYWIKKTFFKESTNIK